MGRGASSPSSAEGLPGGLPSPVSARGLVPSFKNLSRGTASRPLLSQPVLAGFSKVCSCLLPAQPHPRPGPAVRPAGRLHLRRERTERRSQFRHLRLSALLPGPLCKVGQLQAHASPPTSPSPDSRRPRFPHSFHPEQPVPAGWRLAPLSSLPPRPCCSGASCWRCKVRPGSGVGGFLRGALS